MPRISTFFGIAIMMYWKEHGVPHFHAEYQGQEAVVAIDTLEVIDGKLSPTALKLVIQWATEHQGELQENWQLCRSKQMPNTDA